MFGVNIYYQGSIDKLNVQDALETSIHAAFEWLGQYIVFKGIIDVQVNIDETSTGRFSGTGPTHNHLGSINGFDTWESDSISESRTGIDVNPATPEFIINIDPQSNYLQKLWWDPTPLTLDSGEIPNNKSDAFSVVLHEILHGMGISGWLNWDNGEHTGSNQSIWDSLITIDNGRAYFTGANTVALLGEPVEVRLGSSQGAYHLGAAQTQQPFLKSSIMNSYYFVDGERYLPASLEFAILEDLGWTLTSSIMPNVIDPLDDLNRTVIIDDSNEGNNVQGTSKNDVLEGLDGNDILIGGPGDDIIDGGKGNDILMGDSGNDILKIGHGSDHSIGGDGEDVFHFYALGYFIIQDFDKTVDLLTFDADETGLYSIQDLLAVIHLEDNDHGVTLHFINDIASINLVGIHSEDLSASMAAFV